MRDGDTYRQNRKAARKDCGMNSMLKEQRLALGISRRLHDRMRGEIMNPAQAAATKAKALALSNA